MSVLKLIIGTRVLRNTIKRYFVLCSARIEMLINALLSYHHTLIVCLFLKRRPIQTHYQYEHTITVQSKVPLPRDQPHSVRQS